MWLLICFSLYTVAVKARERIGAAIVDLLPIIMQVAVLAGVHWLSVEELTKHHTLGVLYLFGLNFATLVSQLQIAHVADEPFNGFLWPQCIYYSLFIELLIQNKLSLYATLPLPCDTLSFFQSSEVLLLLFSLVATALSTSVLTRHYNLNNSLHPPCAQRH